MNSAQKQRNSKGMTLIELMIAMAIGLILIAGIWQLFTSQQQSYSIQDETAKMQQRARVAEDFLLKAIQQAGAVAERDDVVSMLGRPIMAAGDHFIAVQFDDPHGETPNVVSNEEIAIFAVSKETGAAKEIITIPVAFDQDGDGTVEVGEQFDVDVDLFLDGPPYNLYRYTPDNANPTGTAPYRELIATNVDNLVLKYYDKNGIRIPSDPNTKKPLDMPYELTNTGENPEVSLIQTVESEIVLRAEKRDPKFSEEYPVENYSVGTYDASGNPRSGFTFGGTGDGDATLNAQYRRRTYKSRSALRNLATNNCGTISLEPDGIPICPDGVTLKATVKDGDNNLVSDATTVTFDILNRDPTAADQPSLSPTVTTTSGGIATTVLSYDGPARAFIVEAAAKVDCGDAGEVTIYATYTVNFLPGEPTNVYVNFVDHDYRSATVELDVPPYRDGLADPMTTCYDDNYIFSAKVTDACGNEVAPNNDFKFSVYDDFGNQVGKMYNTLDNGAAATPRYDHTESGATVNLTQSFEYFSVSGPKAWIDPSVTTPDPEFGFFNLNVYPDGGVLPAWVKLFHLGDYGASTPIAPVDDHIFASNRIHLYPWAPNSYNMLEDNISGQQSEDCELYTDRLFASLEVLDCNGNRVYNTNTPQDKGRVKSTLPAPASGYSMLADLQTSPSIPNDQRGDLYTVFYPTNEDTTGYTTWDPNDPQTGYDGYYAFTDTAGLFDNPDSSPINQNPADALYLDNQYQDGAYRVYYDSICAVSPGDFTPASPMRPPFDLTPVGYAGATTTITPDVPPCRDCGVTVSPDVVATCEGISEVKVAFCQPQYRFVELEIIGGKNPYWFSHPGELAGVTPTVAPVTVNPTNPRKALVFTIPDPDYPGDDERAAALAKLSIGNTATGETITIKATSVKADSIGITAAYFKPLVTGGYELDSQLIEEAESPAWSCNNDGTLTVDNLCENFQMFYLADNIVNPIVNGGKYCASNLFQIYFQFEHCFDGSDMNLVDGHLPTPLNVYMLDEVGQQYDRERIYFYPITSTGTANTTFRGTINMIPYTALKGVPYSDSLEYPEGRGSSISVQPWTNHNDGADSCPADDWNITLIPPIPVCFPNAITSGGGAAWSGNFLVHWGDVVVRGQLTVPLLNKRIEKRIDGQFNGAPFGGANNTDRFVDVYVGRAGTGEVNDGLIQGVYPTSDPNYIPGFVYQPYKPDGYGNYFTNISRARISELIVLLQYDLMRELALNHSENSYWLSVDMGSAVPGLYNPKTKVLLNNINELLSFPDSNPNYDGDYVFIDTWGLKNTVAGGPAWLPDQSITGELIDKTPAIHDAKAGQVLTDALPRHEISGDFYTTGIIYVAGTMSFGGLGGTTPIVVQTPPGQEMHYKHNSMNFTEADIPVRPDPSVPKLSPNPTVSVHINGAIYCDGEFAGSGNPQVYGALNSERGYSGNGNPEVWYNYSLNESGSQNALCVECCALEVSPRVLDLGVGDSQQLTVKDSYGDIVWQSSDTNIATVSSTGYVTAHNVGDALIWVVDANNCTQAIPTRVATECVGYAMQPPVVPEDPVNAPFQISDFNGDTEILTIVNSDGDPYPFSDWVWTADPDPLGNDVVTVTPLGEGVHTAWITAQKCGTTVVHAEDSTGICGGIYESIVTVSSPLAIRQTSPVKTRYEVGDTVTLTANGGNGTILWVARPATAVSFDTMSGETVNVTFNYAVDPVSIDAYDELNCVADIIDFYVDCPEPTVSTVHPPNFSTWGELSTNGVNLYWQAEPFDDHQFDPAAPATGLDEIDRVEFTIRPDPMGISPIVDSTLEYCGLSISDNCALDAINISEWPDGDYLLTATAYTNYTEPEILSGCPDASLPVVSETTITIDNCQLDWYDNFTYLDPAWRFACVGGSCYSGNLTLQTIDDEYPLGLGVVVYNDPTIGGRMFGQATVDQSLNETLEGEDFATAVTATGMIDRDDADVGTSGQGLSVREAQFGPSNHFTVVGYANPPLYLADPTAKLEPQELHLKYNIGGGEVDKPTGIIVKPPYMILIIRNAGVFSAYYRYPADASWTAIGSLPYAIPVGTPLYVGPYVESQSDIDAATWAGFKDFTMQCLMK
ncbi:MAG: hypothetical protein C0609_04480 [Deltaproteobacteria bacterium]|nr:MAG: hypothetical protein C0609_04480 [Deltaproteobacteria bacterium]